MTLVLFQLGLEPFEQGEGIGRSPGKSGEDAVVIKATHLARGLLDNDIAEGDLAIATHGHG
jgi:hypothetical protein